MHTRFNESDFIKCKFLHIILHTGDSLIGNKNPNKFKQSEFSQEDFTQQIETKQRKQILLKSWQLKLYHDREKTSHLFFKETLDLVEF